LATRLSIDLCSTTNDLVEPEEIPALVSRLRQELGPQPEDLERQLELGRWLKRAGDTPAAVSCFRRAVEAGRKKATLIPREGRVLAGLGEALFETGQFAEAEEACRQAVQDAPNDSGCWLGLGIILDRRAASLLMPERKPVDTTLSPDGLTPQVLARKPKPETFRRCEELRHEATACFDRAASLAAKDPEVFLRRAAHRCASAMFSALSRHYRGEQKLDARGLTRSYCAAEAVSDLQQADRLSPNKYQIIGSIAFLEWFTGPAPAPGGNPPPRLGLLPEAARKTLLQAMAQLNGLGQNADKKLAAGALETLAMLKIAASADYAGASTDLGRAVVLDAARESCWELLIGACSHTAAPEEVTGLCRVRLSLKDNAHNRLLLAKALARQQKWDEAAAEAEATLHLDRDSIPAHILLVAVDLRRSTDPAALNLAASHLFRAKQLLARWPHSEEKDERLREVALNAALLNALGEEPQSARKWIEPLLDRDPNDPTAKEILSALDSAARDLPK